MLRTVVIFMRAEALLLNGAAQGGSHLVSALPPLHHKVHVGSCGVACSMAGASVGMARGVFQQAAQLCALPCGPMQPMRSHCAAVTVFTNLTFSDAAASAASITWLTTAQGSAPVVKGSVK